jgi:hypothetical protein
MRRYTWRESALIISPSVRNASAAATAVFPLAVGPNIVIIVCFMLAKLQKVSDTAKKGIEEMELETHK